MYRFDSVYKLYAGLLPADLDLQDVCASGASSASSKRDATPFLIGGTQSQKEQSSLVAIDWLQGSCPVEKMEKVFRLISSVLGARNHPAFTEKGAMLYDCGCVWENHGVAIFFDSAKNLDKDLHRGRFVLQFRGEFFHQQPLAVVMSLFTQLREVWFKCTRLDICFDDFQKIRKPYQVANDAFKGSYAGFRNYQHIFSKQKGGELTSDTVYFGKRGKMGSGKFLRVYDKNLESKGAIDAIRWEVEWTKEKAFTVFQDLFLHSATEKEFVLRLGGIIGGSISFMQMKSKNLDRNKNLYWWKKILSVLGEKVSYPAPVRTTSLQKTVDHVLKTFPVTLATLKEVFGDTDFEGFMREILNGGKNRISDDPRLMAKQAFYKEVFKGGQE